MLQRISLSVALGVALWFGIPSVGNAQVMPGGDYGAHAHHPHPYVFLSGSCGSHHLNGETGNGHYIYQGIVWYEPLQKDGEDYYYVYYHEMNYPGYRWAFAKYATCHGIVRVYHKFPEHYHFKYFHGAHRKITGPQPYGTKEMRQGR